MSSGDGIYNFFRNFFMPNSKPPESPKNESGLVNDFRNPIWDTYESDDSDNDFRSPANPFTFNVYSDPIEIHRFFEQAMNEMIKNFQIFDSFNNDSDDQFQPFDSPGLFSPPFGKFDTQPPAIEGPKRNLRDEYLKPGYTAPSNKDGNPAKSDTILDGRINSQNIGEILDKKDEAAGSSSVMPYRPEIFSTFIGKSYMSRTVRRPDGTTEHEEIVKDSNGNEKKTVTRRSQDGGEYTVTTYKDASGADIEKSTEDFNVTDPFKNFPGWGNRSSKWWNW